MSSSSTPIASASPTDTIQRVLYLTANVHVYAIPPLQSTKGHVAAAWTSPPSRQIFTARLRLLETAPANDDSNSDGAPRVTTELLLEDPSTGELFAAAPYTDASAVEQAIDSVRFFAVRVVGEGGRKAVLGMGFEERSDAFDFGVALQAARTAMGMEKSGGAAASGVMDTRKPMQSTEEPKKRDFSLKEGQTITVDLGGKMGSNRSDQVGDTFKAERYIAPPSASKDAFGLASPPPSGRPVDAGVGFLPPPPYSSKSEKRRSRNLDEHQAKTLEELGFDDGEFGEFQ